MRVVAAIGPASGLTVTLEVVNHMLYLVVERTFSIVVQNLKKASPTYTRVGFWLRDKLSKC